MPLLILNSARPPVAVANKTPVNKSVVAPQGKGDDVLTEILQKLTAIQAELGITPEPQQDPVEREEILKRMEMLRAAKIAKMQLAEQERKDFVKRMQKGKKKAQRKRERESGL